MFNLQINNSIGQFLLETFNADFDTLLDTIVLLSEGGIMITAFESDSDEIAIQCIDGRITHIHEKYDEDYDEGVCYP